MNLPIFTAAASIYPSKAHYASGSWSHSPQSSVALAAMSQPLTRAPACISACVQTCMARSGSYEQCWQDCQGGCQGVAPSVKKTCG